jgi:hypothetical protein
MLLFGRRPCLLSIREFIRELARIVLERAPATEMTPILYCCFVRL